TGQAAFKGSSPATTLEQIQSIDPLPIARFRKGVPADVDAVIRRCLTKHPRRRYLSAREVADELRRAAEGRPTKARSPNFVVRIGQWAKRNPVAFVTLGIGLLALLTILILAASHSGTENQLRTQITRLESESRSDKSNLESRMQEVALLRERDVRAGYYHLL